MLIPVLYELDKNGLNKGSHSLCTKLGLKMYKMYWKVQVNGQDLCACPDLPSVLVDKGLASGYIKIYNTYPLIYFC